MERCIFCEIAAGRAPASVVYEDDEALAFMDIHPVTPGHTLIIPKRHYRNIFGCPPDVAARLMELAAKLANPMRAATGCEGMNLFMAAEAVALQDVWHIHLHLIPRTAGDGFGLRTPEGYPRRAPYEELDEIAAKIRSCLPAPDGGQKGAS
ncbi:MAG: HIT family protein [Chloroflexi bacterium]|mgnify:CR=1 FL=1|nr:HIT family protein [Chloroflexota bacterium]